MPLKIHNVVACCNNGGIGYKNSLPWRLKKEMAHFCNLTKGEPESGKQNIILMGRKTWDSLPRPLPGRYNFVLSRSLKEKAEGMDGISNCLDEFAHLMMSDEWSEKVNDIFCIGGAEVYKLVFESEYCGRVYLTKVLADYKCDVFLPSLKEFQTVQEPVGIPFGLQCEEDGTKWVVEVLVKS